jgi:hypothetical protein
VLVGVVDVDVASAFLVRDPGDRTGEVRVLGQPCDPHDLAGADVRADLDGKAGVALESLFRRHRPRAYSSRCYFPAA